MTSNRNGETPRTDRRLDQRLNSRLEAVVTGDTPGPHVFTTNGFSRTGAFLRRRNDATPLPAVGSVIKIEFRWPLESEMSPVRVDATVIRQTDDGIGVRFEIAA